MCYLREFRTFVAVYEERSFTAAAQRMNATQSGISQQIKKIEQVVGIRLFDRGTRLVKPTAEGHLYYSHCSKLLRDYDRTISVLQHNEEPSSDRIALGVVPWLSSCILPPLLTRFGAAYPGIQIDVEEASAGVLQARLNEGHLNFVVSEDDVFNSDTVSEGAFSQCVLVTSRHERGNSRDVAPSDISSLNMILPPAATPLRNVADRFFAQHGIVPKRSIEINSISAAVNLASRSGWSAFVPVVALVAEIATIECVVDRLVGGPEIGVMVRSRRETLSGIQQKFREQLVAELGRFALNTKLIVQSHSSQFSALDMDEEANDTRVTPSHLTGTYQPV